MTYSDLTALSHCIRGSGLPAYEVSSTTRAPRNTVVLQGPPSMVAGVVVVVIEPMPRRETLTSVAVLSFVLKLLLNSVTSSSFRERGSLVISVQKTIFKIINVLFFIITVDPGPVVHLVYRGKCTGIDCISR